MPSESTFLELYLINEPSLRAFVRALVHDRGEFEDAFQTVVLVLWKKFETYDTERPFGPWARGVAAKELLRLRRGSSKQPTAFSPLVVEAILDSFDRRSEFHARPSERMEALEHCVEALPDESQQIISLKYRRAMTISDIAKDTGGTVAAIQKSLSRIRQRLAGCVERRLAGASE